MPNLFRKKAVAYDNSEFGLKRCLSDADTSDPRILVDAARTALTQFTGPTPLSEDASLLALRRRAPSA